MAVRLRPLRGDCDAERPVWRSESIADQHWVYLGVGNPRGGGPCAAASGGGTGGAAVSSSPASGIRTSYEGARFRFDLCFDGRTPNSDVFKASARDVIRSCHDGLNATVLAYGQTNSGKTHSILGTLREPGILPLAMHDLFEGEGSARMADYAARVSYFEIFNERVIDLLVRTHADSTNLPVKEDAERGFYVQGLSSAPVCSSEDVLRLVERGEERRRYAQTRFNEYSSRSHVLFTLMYERVASSFTGDVASGGTGAADSMCLPAPVCTAKVSIVDLAGCENHKVDQSEDGRYINRSLFFLGEVISRLCASSMRSHRAPSSGQRTREMTPHRRLSATTGDLTLGHETGSTQDSSPGRRSWEVDKPGTVPALSRSPSRSRERSEFIPYRDSKLTRILRASLGGNAVTLLLVTIHPGIQFLEQTMTSLRFATKAQSVENIVESNSQSVVGRIHEQSTIDAQQRIIEGLQQRLRSLELERSPARDLSPGRSTLALGELRRRWDMRRDSGPGVADCRSSSLDGVFQGMLDSDFRRLMEEWMLAQFQGLRCELQEKEQQLAAKARLLSEREQQLGQLRERLTSEPPSQPSFSRGPASVVFEGPPDGVAQPSLSPPPAFTHKSSQGAQVAPPSDSGKLVTGASADARVSIAARPSATLDNGAAPVLSVGSIDSPSSADASDAPTLFQQVQSRAEDIACLRKSLRYVTRQQMPIPGTTEAVDESSPSPALGTSPSSTEVESASALGEGQPTGRRESQKELVERLLHMAVQRINRMKSGSADNGCEPIDQSDVDYNDSPDAKDSRTSGRPVLSGSGSSPTSTLFTATSRSPSQQFSSPSQLDVASVSAGDVPPRTLIQGDGGSGGSDGRQTSLTQEELESFGQAVLLLGEIPSQDSSLPPSNPNVESTPRRSCDLSTIFTRPASRGP